MNYSQQVRHIRSVLVLGLVLFTTVAAGAPLITGQGGEFEVLVQYYCGSPNPIESSREVIETDDLQSFSDERSIAIEAECGMGSAAGTWTASIFETQIDLGYELSTEVLDCGGAISGFSAYVSFQLEESTNIVLTSRGSWEPTNEPGSSPSARLWINGALQYLWHLNDGGTEHRLETLLEPGEYTFAILGSSSRGLRAVNGACLAIPGTTHAAGWARLVFESGQVSTRVETFGSLRARY